MNRLWFWFVFGVFFTLSIMMVVFGILFIRDVYYSSRGEVAFGSLLVGVILLLTGGGLFSSTIAETVRKLLKK